MKIKGGKENHPKGKLRMDNNFNSIKVYHKICDIKYFVFIC